MTDLPLTMLLAGVVAGAAPIVLAALGETLSEKVGLINLSLDGTILLAAMTAFVAALASGSVAAGFLAGGLVGTAVALVVGLFAIAWRQSQVAVGFVLTLMTRDLAYFVGNPYSNQPGPSAPPLPLPWLSELPGFGPVLFSHSAPVYMSLALIPLLWFALFHTRWGLRLRAVGENPAAAFARGFHPARVQIVCLALGGLLVGLAGAAFSLAAKPGWGRPQGCEGTGWIALALVIFGGWHPVRAAVGAYLFAFLQVIGIHLQQWLPAVPSQVFQVAPFPLMIFTLLLVNLLQRKRAGGMSDSPLRRALRLLTGDPPAALGRPLQRDG
jgi:simple sugar transport system permease protein